ncbi:MAG: nucleoside triphosphate pyrophosphohydrolase family protein [Actinomycetota bacterium]|nr:nucleoside triphosphate pyrophosphohydrolase family protein [Actinomycetota bacterium]
MKLETFAVYQCESRRTWRLIQTDASIVYPTLGLANEAGEVTGKIKKILRDRDGRISLEDRQGLKQELGDVLWYLTQMCWCQKGWSFYNSHPLPVCFSCK